MSLELEFWAEVPIYPDCWSRGFELGVSTIFAKTRFLLFLYSPFTPTVTHFRASEEVCFVTVGHSHGPVVYIVSIICWVDLQTSRAPITGLRCLTLVLCKTQILTPDLRCQEQGEIDVCSHSVVQLERLQ